MKETPGNSGPVEAHAEEHLVLPVEGMTCASCVTRVEKALRRVNGVDSASVSLATREVSLTFDPAKTSLDSLAGAVADAGYTLVTVPATSAGDGLQNDPIVRRESEYSRLKKKALLSALLALPVMVVSMAGMLIEPFSDSPAAGEALAALVLTLTTAVLLGPGREFFTISLRLARHRTADMNTLIAVGTGTAYLYSVSLLLAPLWGGPAHAVTHTYFDSAATIITLVIIGRMLEARAHLRTTTALSRLLRLQPGIAHLVKDGRTVDLPLAQVRKGDTLMVKPGETVPADGTVSRGETTVDESAMTGESIPVEKRHGDRLLGGTINGFGSVEFVATSVGEATLLSHIVRLVRDAQGAKPPIQKLVDRIAAVFVPAVIAAAILTFAYWTVLGGEPVALAIQYAVAVLIIACPCALGLATPTAIIVGIDRAASDGILIRNPDALERARGVDLVVFDKTGTLTVGRLTVRRVVPASGTSEDELLRLAGALERHSEHPIGKAVAAYAASKGELPQAESFAATPGAGVTGIVGGVQVLVGSANFLDAHGVDLTAREVLLPVTADGKASVYVGIDGILAGMFVLEDELAGDAHGALEGLRHAGIRTAILSGDKPEIARKVGAMLGVDDVIAGVLPDQKGEEIRRMQSEGRRVAMVGDGINDAPALAIADVGIAVARGSAVALESADVALLRDDLNGVLNTIVLSRAMARTIRQNLFWAFIYNVVGIPLAAAGYLHPMLAAGAMALSSVSVVANALRLRRYRLPR